MNPSLNSIPFRLAIFASGAGSNAQKIIDHFRDHPIIKVALIVCNKKKAGVLEIAQRENITTLLIEKDVFNETGYVNLLQENHINFIVLAGFLWKVPPVLIRAFPEKIINIHPALLPAYGGRGMYGMAVHEAVIKSGEKESGITIHYVDEIYDNGRIIFQTKCDIGGDESPESLANKIHLLEHTYFPREIEKVVEKVIQG